MRNMCLSCLVGLSLLAAATASSLPETSHSVQKRQTIGKSIPRPCWPPPCQRPATPSRGDRPSVSQPHVPAGGCHSLLPSRDSHSVQERQTIGKPIAQTNVSKLLKKEENRKRKRKADFQNHHSLVGSLPPLLILHHSDLACPRYKDDLPWGSLSYLSSVSLYNQQLLYFCVPF
jgi:hypothetical protein